MGTPIISPDPEYGRDCALCRPRPWPAGKTPKYVYAYFEGITNCGRSPNPPPNGQTFTLEQSPVNNCVWNHQGDTWFVEWQAKRFIPNDSLLVLLDTLGWAFFSASEAPCPSDPAIFINDMLNCFAFFAGSEGLALLTQNKQVLFLVEAFGLRAGIDLMWEMFQNPQLGIVHKFCDLYQRTNIKFLF